MESIQAISVLDGRYLKYTRELTDIFSEYGLIRHRVFVETEWLKFLLQDLGLDTADEAAIHSIDSISAQFDLEAAKAVKEREAVTNHDVKAVEYYIKDRLCGLGLERLKEWVHFGCTSDDINNSAYALMLRAGRAHAMADLEETTRKLEELAEKYKKTSMLARTHGQPATPTTLGKEMTNFAWRLRSEADHLCRHPIQAKMNGASGNFCAHHFAFPDIDWISASQRFIADRLGLSPILLTTQINPNNYMAALLQTLIRIAATVIDLDRDMWGYISLGYFKQKSVATEIGSSTMPHKVNPIDFENSEGNMGLAISMMEHMAVKLLQSRFQRDLTDSTVLRNLGAGFGYLAIGFKSTLKGLSRVEADERLIAEDLAGHPEILAEAVQTVMRIYKEENPYEKLKMLTRGRTVSRPDMEALIGSMENVPADVKNRLLQLRVEQYTGLSDSLVDWYFSKNR
jgi:adenylosuccinate lyase